MLQSPWPWLVGAVATLLAMIVLLVIPANARVTYFSPSLFEPSADCATRSGQPWPAVDGFEVDWYGGHWMAGREPSLYQHSKNAAAGAKAYRFTLLPSFRYPVFVRVEEQPNGEMVLIAKRLSGAGGYAPGSIKDQVARRLTESEAAHLRKVIEAADLSTLPPCGGANGADGARWIFESSEAGRYTYANRWEPRDDAMLSLGIAFVALTDWRSIPDRYYSAR